MIFNKKSIIVLLIIVGTLAILGVACAHDFNDNAVVKDSKIVKEAKSTNIKTVKVKIYNFKPYVSRAPKAVKFKTAMQLRVMLNTKEIRNSAKALELLHGTLEAE